MSSTLELSTLGCSSTHNNSLQVYREQHRVPRWSYLLLAVQVYTTIHCRLIENSIEFHAGVIYSRLFKYTQHTTGLYRTALSSTLELSTLGCSSTHNNSLQVYREQHGVPRWSYLLLAVQVHTTTHCRFIENTIESHAGVIYSRLFKYTQQHTAGV